MLISILAPAWGASAAFLYSPGSNAFQFSPPRGGRPAFWEVIIMAEEFQFSPPRGGRPPETLCRMFIQAYFNSRPRVGGVRSGRIIRRRALRISILAPAWGASSAVQTHCYTVPNFNSRPRVGGVCKFIQMKSAVYVQNGRNEDCKLLPIIGLWVNPLKINGRLCAD